MVKELEDFFGFELKMILDKEEPKKKRAPRKKKPVEAVVEPKEINPLDAVYKQIENKRVTGREISRFGFVTANGEVRAEYDTVCFASLQYHRGVEVGDYLYAVWNGEPKIVNGDENRGNPQRNEPGFFPGPMSDRWLSFILGDQSPWKAVHPYLATTDVDVVRKSGFIFKVTDDLNMDLVYNFLIATRYTYEFNRRGAFWLRMVEEREVDPRIAFLVSISFMDVLSPLQKKIIHPAGFRKDEKGEFIKDRWGDRQHFPEESEEIGPIPPWDGTLKRITGDNHTPLDTMDSNILRIMNSDPALIKHNTVFNKSKRGSSWDMWKTGREDHINLARGVKPTLEVVLAHVNNVLGEAQKKAA